MMRCRIGHSGERGFALIATAVSLVAVIGIAGVSVDLGRMYIVKSELMAYTDASSVAAALQLDGTVAGLARAQTAVTGMADGSNAMGWDFDTKTISGVTVQFAQGLAATPNLPDATTWNANPASPGDYRFVQVTASANVPLTFMQAFGILQSGTSAGTATTAASSVAAQALITQYPAGLLPFSPIGPSSVPNNFGFTPGVQYTIRYPSGGSLKIVMCVRATRARPIGAISPHRTMDFGETPAPRRCAERSWIIRRASPLRWVTRFPSWAGTRTRRALRWMRG
jgi:Putative Flp pilus-assembly TadE/G-like